MAVLRIVPNMISGDPAALADFWQGLFDLDRPMQMDFITTVQASGTVQPPQVSFATEGGNGTPLPALSVEVDDLDAVRRRAAAMGVALEYGPVREPWGVRRLFLRDPAGRLINVLQHDDAPANA